ncbi:hypothetical protein O181_031130 [Austropuccinia psidii MF-1]|uniref:RRM domain-containing protein n=1 Tax=Austropuccinia psidii MF-1 TaxID=1389203 RepID=A0A9Q3CXE3_9BASI|nr:hypothetical protein [Austropuccinia psidii MF-1]
MEENSINQETRSTSKLKSNNKNKNKENVDNDKNKKEGKEEDKNTTLFVSNLSKSITSNQLIEKSSLIGPIKTAFIIKDSKNSESKGFGYIKFIFKEDAKSALNNGLGNFTEDENDKDEKNKNSKQNYKLSWAKPKRLNLHKNNNTNEKLEQEEEEEEEEEEGEAKSKSKKRFKEDDKTNEFLKLEKEKRKKTKFLIDRKKDLSANRTVVLQGLPISNDLENPINQDSQDQDQNHQINQKCITKKTLFKKVKKLGRLESIEFPIHFPLTASSLSAHLIFSDPNSAAIANSKLHGHVFKGNFLTSTIKARLDATTRLGHAFGGRLIIRNLPFDITEQDLRYLFAPFGPIHSIDIPLAKSDDQTISRGRGFAFVWMLSETDASRAIEKLNNSKVCTGMSQEIIQNETNGEKKSQKRKQKKTLEINLNDRSRTIAVDWALSKKKFEEAEIKEGQETHDEHSHPMSASDQEINDLEQDSEQDSDLESDKDSIGSQSSESNLSDMSKSSHDESDPDHQENKKSINDNQGTTLFVRNLSFEATEDELHALFRPFGPLRYARIVMDPKLGRSRGTGFVCLWNKEDAQKVLDLAKNLEKEGAGQGPLAANGLPSLLQPDPSSSLAAQLTLHGRVLGVSEAVSREQAEKLRIDRDKLGEGKDKRHLFLMREGVIFPNSYEAKALLPADLSARQQSFDERKALLRSNLSLFISYTRLSIRQIPLYVSERCLKRLARHALSQWRKEVKTGQRPDLTEEELSRQFTSKQANDKKTQVTPKKLIQSKVKQVKILRTADKIDPISRLGKSKGYGFLEMENHADAIKVLRWANANPIVDRLLKEWTCEELENIIKHHYENEDNKKVGKDKGNEDVKNKKVDQDKGSAKKDFKILDEERIEKMKSKVDELRAEIGRTEKKRNVKGDKLGDELHKGKSQDAPTKSHRMLIIEFAIENSQTIKKRFEKKERSLQKLSLKNNNQNTTQVKEAFDDRLKFQGSNSTLPKRHHDFNSEHRKKKAKVADSQKGQGDEKAKNEKLGHMIGQKRFKRKLRRKS